MIAVAGAGSAGPWWRQIRWWIAILLCLSTAINHIDRQALSLAAPVILKTFHLDSTQFGWINSGFLFAYAVGQMISGPVIDVLGTRRSMSLAVVWWSLAGMLHAVGRGFSSFLGLRLFLGITESANFPSAFKAISEWFPRKERSLATGIITAGTGIGAMLAPPLIGMLIHFWGWRAAFLVPGAAGLLWAVLWRRFYHLPADHPAIGRAELDLIESGRQSEAVTPARAPWISFLRYRAVWGLMLARFIGDGGYYFFSFWLPTYLSQVRGFNVTKIAMFAWIPFLASDLGSLGGGWAGRKLIDLGMTLEGSRKTIIWVGALVVTVSTPAVFADSSVTAILLISVAMFGIQFKSSSLFALPTDLFPAHQVATVWGLAGAMGSFGAMLFQPMIGWIADNFSYAPVFVAVPLMQIAAALIVVIFIRGGRGEQ